MEAQASPDQNNRNKCTNCGKMIHRGSWARHFWLAIPCPDDACEARLWHHKLSDGVKHLLNRHPETFTNIEMAKETLKTRSDLLKEICITGYCTSNGRLEDLISGITPEVRADLEAAGYGRLLPPPPGPSPMMTPPGTIELQSQASIGGSPASFPSSDDWYSLLQCVSDMHNRLMSLEAAGHGSPLTPPEPPEPRNITTPPHTTGLQHQALVGGQASFPSSEDWYSLIQLVSNLHDRFVSFEAAFKPSSL